MAVRYEFRIQVNHPDFQREMVLPLGTTSVGRQPGNDLVLEDTLVSRRHARFACTETECTLIDLGGVNGTFVRRQKLAPNVPVRLEPGDLIRIGPYELELTARAVEEAPRPEPAPPELDPPVPAHSSTGDGQEYPPGDPGQPVPEGTLPNPALEATEDGAAPPQPPGLPSYLCDADELPPLGRSIRSRRLIGFLPSIYHDDFMARFLGIFETTLNPIEWTIANFDLYLDPGTAPAGFLPWLADWFGIRFDPAWSDAQRRLLLKDAYRIYAMRGTRWALGRVLEIFTGVTPLIDDTSANLPAYTFRVSLPLQRQQADAGRIEALIDAYKPAHTTYILEFSA